MLGNGSSSRVPVYQEQGPEFNHHHNDNNNKRTITDQNTYFPLKKICIVINKLLSSQENCWSKKQQLHIHKNPKLLG
jgi:hypothetical protein